MSKMTHIYRGVAYNVEADESKSQKAFVGVYRGQKYTAQQTQRPQKSKTGTYRGISWTQ